MAKIILENKAKIDIEVAYLEDLLAYASLPDGSILLVLHDNSLPEKNQGVCVASQLFHLASEYKDICSCPNSAKWDCCVAINRKWCLSRDNFPAYFTYLLGHEFGHVNICLSSITLHIHCCLIHDWIRPASNSVIQYAHELPNEQLFDQFGKYLSFKIHGDKKFDHQTYRFCIENEDGGIVHLGSVMFVASEGNGGQEYLTKSMESMLKDQKFLSGVLTALVEQKNAMQEQKKEEQKKEPTEEAPNSEKKKK